MIQRFIEIGEGYSDIFELLEVIERNHDRLQHIMVFKTEKKSKPYCSFVVILKPTLRGDFQPLYICKEGIPYEENYKNQRLQILEETATKFRKELIELNVRSSDSFSEDKLYYQYLIGILRMNRYILPLT